jgi:hypothetical protein
MQLVLAPFDNQPQIDFVLANVPASQWASQWACWSCYIMKDGETSSWGVVDAMMCKDVNAIARRYTTLIRKRGQECFNVGDAVTITIEIAYVGASFTLKGKIVT